MRAWIVGTALAGVCLASGAAAQVKPGAGAPPAQAHASAPAQTPTLPPTDDLDAARVVLAEGQNLFQTGNYAEARIRFERLMQIAPGYIDGQLWRGQARRALGDNDGALADFTETAERFPTDANPWIQTGVTYQTMGDAARAANAYSTALEMDATVPGVWARLSQVRNALGDNHGALEAIQEAVDLQPDNAMWVGQRGMQRSINGDNAGAMDDITGALAVAETEPDLWYWFYQIEVRAGDDEAALNTLDQAVERFPDVVSFRTARSGLRLDARYYDGAIEDADMAAGLEPQNAGAWNQRCWTRAVSNRALEEAREFCDTALELNRAAHILDSRGMVGMRQLLWAEAFADYDEAVRLDPQSAQYRYGRGLTAMRLGRLDEGRADIAAAITLDPTVAQSYAFWGFLP